MLELLLRGRIWIKLKARRFNGKKINKGANEEDYDTGWYHVICEGSLYVCKVYVDGDSDHRGERVWTTCFTSINN